MRRFCGVAVALVLGLGFAAPAVAGVLTKSGTQITYFAASGEVNSVMIALAVNMESGVVTLLVKDDGAAINGLSPCTSAAAGAWASCPGGAIDVVLGDQNDTFGPAGPPYENLLFPTTVRVWGGTGNDLLTGREGDQIFYGEAGADTLSGADGDDILEGGDGDDTLRGAGDEDVLDGGSGADTLDGGDGFDEADYSTRTDDLTVLLDGVANDGWRFTTPPPKELVTEGDNVVVELVRTGSGSDHLIGGSLSDHLLAGEGNNVVDGGDGNDFLTSGGGADSLAGGPGGDEVDAGGGTDSVAGGDHTDRLSGGEGADTLNGDAGDDRLTGGADADTLNGGDGFDSLDGGPGGAGDADVLDGGAGGDFADYRLREAVVTVDLTIESGQGDGVENDTITAVENAFGGSGNDTLRGDDNANVLRGFDGDDLLQGRAGNDVLGDRRLCGPSFCLEAEFGADSLAGGAGDDVIFGGAGNDTAIYADAAARVNVNLSTGGATGEGTDIMYVVENVVGSRYGDVLVGSASANVLRGGAGYDKLIGGKGRDTLLGGGGNDRLYAKDGIRDLSVNGGRGRDGAKRDGRDPLVSVEYIFT